MEGMLIACAQKIVAAGPPPSSTHVLISASSSLYIHLVPPPSFSSIQDHVVLRYEAVLEPSAGKQLIKIDAGRRWVAVQGCRARQAESSISVQPLQAITTSCHLARSPPCLPACRFVVSFFMADQTIAVYEPPQPNTGIPGGKFLKRGRVYKPGNKVVSCKLQRRHQGDVLPLTQTLPPQQPNTACVCNSA